MKRKLLSTGALALVATALVPALAGAAAPSRISLRGPSNETPSAWFVQLSGAPIIDGNSAANVENAQSAFQASAKQLGLDVTIRHAFGTLWNGVSVSVPVSQVGSLSSIPGVTTVYPVRPISIPPSPHVAGTPDDAGSNPMIGVDPTAGGVGPYQGQNVKVAVIDSGIDYTNPDLGGCFGRGCRVVGGWDFVGNSYDDASTDLDYQPVPHPGASPAPCDPNFADAQVTAGRASTSVAGHGTHVAGIIGAKAASAGGVTGVAPRVQFLAYKVFGCNGSTADDNVVAALERAYKDGAQVVNMSLGADYTSWPEEPTAQASDELVSHGIVVVAAEGNAGGVNTALFSGGDPAVGNGVLAVGSVDNVKPSLPYFTFDGGQEAGYFSAAGTVPAPTAGSGSIVTSATNPLGCNPYDAGVAGHIVLIKRGTCTFYMKAMNAQAAGATGVVLFNNAPGFVNPTVAGTPPVTIPVVAVSDTEGGAIATAITSGGGSTPLTWTAKSDFFPNSTGGFVSSFSSWGPSAELGLKPDLVAPGGLIRSTWPMSQFGGYNVVSGTSMASPQVAGAAAVLLSAGRSPANVGTLLSNYAEPAVWSGNPTLGLLESPLREGAGLIKVDRAVAATVTATPRKVSLGEGFGGSQVLTLRNTGSTAKTYNATYTSAISPYPANAAWPSSFGFDAFEDIVAFSSPSVTVPAGGTASLSAKVSINLATPAGELYGGYIQLMPTDGGNAITIPYAGYAGDYQAQQVLNDPAGLGLPTLAKADGTPVTGPGTTYTLANGDDPVLVFHLNLPATLVNVQIANASGSVLLGYADKESYFPRNSSPTSFFTFTWDGSRIQNSRPVGATQVLNGTYRLVLSVLKPLGNRSSAADWETFTTPSFRIARP